jgi:hypothetical protein
MTVYIFTGPTISAEEARDELDAVYLPPVSQGDVYRVAKRHPRAIGIIDGYFEHVPSVWHKEILWAMREGIHVFGSASMGALRAAELASFGMEGVGDIFEAYHSGAIEDDDEVAVAHGTREYGYRAFSTAMVDIRATVERAVHEEIIDRDTSLILLNIAKQLYYPRRNYQTILQYAAAQNIAQIEPLRAWISKNRVNRKRGDALSMLRTIRERFQEDVGPKHVGYHFQFTRFFQLLTLSAGTLSGEEETQLHDRLLEEVRLQPGVYERTYQGTIARVLMLILAATDNITITDESLQQITDEFRIEFGLHVPEAVEQWLQRNDIGLEDFTRFLERELRVRHVQATIQPSDINHVMADQLRLTGDYPRLAARARDKQRVLQIHGQQNPGLLDTGFQSEDALFQWYFEEQLGSPVLDDPSAYARAYGFQDMSFFKRALLREYLYRKYASGTPRSDRIETENHHGQ